MKRTRRSGFRKSKLDIALTGINTVLLTALCISIIYPFWMIFMKSVMTDTDIVNNPLALWPGSFQFSGYETIFTNEIYSFGQAFLNSLFLTLLGTVYQLAITTCTAYTLSRKDLPGKKILLYFFVITMYFGGGLIPYYLVIKELQLDNNLAVMIVPSFMNVFNMLVMRSSFASFPKELEEAARIDGASNAYIFTRIVLPLSGGILAAIGLFIAVAQWNNWYTAMLFIDDIDKRPLAYALQIIIEKSKGSNDSVNGQVEVIGKSIQFAAIVVTIVPVMIVYPFFQKHFVKGVMVGSIKE